MKIEICLNENEIQEIQQLLKGLTEQVSSPEDPSFIHNATVFAHQLPLRLKQFLNDFRLCAASIPAICLISGYPIDDKKIGLTPENREQKNDQAKTFEEQVLFVLCSTLLGDIFGWSSQQAGYLVNDVFPVKGQELEQMGSSSRQELMWHTEDSFHPYRADYIGLMCLRNPYQAATTVASNHGLSSLTEKQKQILFEPRFVFRSDDSHLEKHQASSFGGKKEAQTADFLKKACEKINEMNEKPQAVPVLFGDNVSPYLCADAIYLTGIDEEAEQAAQAMINLINTELSDLILQAGDICFIDNYRAVHGRRPFTPKFDGTDRWMQRLNITRDLRKSRDMRTSDISRFIF